MKRFFKLLIVPVTVFTAFTCVAQSNAVAIQKRWMAVDVVGNEAKKESYASRFARHTSEMEFRAGKFIMYKDGVMDGTATYTMASDGKSMVIKEGQTEMMLKIISLKGNTLQAVTSGFMSSKDTIIYKSGQGATVAINANWKNVAAKWANVNTAYQRRADLLKYMIQMLKEDSSIDKKIITSLENARTKAAGVIGLTADKLSAASINTYQEAQDNLSTAVRSTMVAAEHSATLKANSNWQNLLPQLEGIENNIAVSRKDYNDEVMTYNSVQKKNKGVVKNILFKANAGPEKAPEVKFN